MTSIDGHAALCSCGCLSTCFRVDFSLHDDMETNSLVLDVSVFRYVNVIHDKRS